MTGATTKRALLISPAFFGYENDIVEELERQGYATTFIDERPSNSAFMRAIVRVRKTLIERRIQAYYRAKFAEILHARFDRVLVIKAEVVPRWFLEQLRSQNRQARFVFYTYDAISNADNCLDVIDLFDARFTFDSDDQADRPDFDYLPLFYTEDFKPLPSESAFQPRRYDLSFLGTLHSDRYAFAKELFSHSQRVFGFFFVQARWYFALVKYVTREHKGVPWSDVSFRALTRYEIARVFRESHAVLDMQRAGQAGLTMRTFEVLASGSILVTTNVAIEREPFYDPSRIIVVSDDVRSLDSAAINARLTNLPAPPEAPVGFEVYSLASWVNRVLNDGATP
ncbi:MAG: hypothetical protein QM621_07340 [Aeromicrobium sp.]|uniref:glycosyltransferase family protein n=1 Tax=Aeromicrobium sp. TaxID=1871063 RepID=UPI0039E6383B